MELEIVSPLFWSREGKGERGCLLYKLRDWKKIVSPLFWSREGEGKKGVFVMNMGKRSEVISC
jgi:hypothetical protein